MKKSYVIVISVFVLGIFLGFSNNDTPRGLTKKFNNSNITSQKHLIPKQTDNYKPHTISGVPYYTDNFDGDNSTDGLMARGYLLYRNGTFSGTPGPLWFQGNPLVFVALNGPDSGYVADNFEAAGTSGDIDDWMVSPKISAMSGDTLSFYQRSIQDNPFPDSMRVMYSDVGDSTPGAASWVELGRFLANPGNLWILQTYMIPSSGIGARFALRYAVVDGGLVGNNSNYMGVDALNVTRDVPSPVELASFTSVVTNNNVTLSWATVSEINNSGFYIERKSNGQWSSLGFVNGHGTSSTPNNYSFTDRNLNSGNYNYRLKQTDLNGNFEYFNLNNEVNVGVPAKFELSQNYPNPFNPATRIDFQIPNDGNVSITVFDNSGREVMSLLNEHKTSGYYTINFNASSLSSGVYFYKLSSGDFTSVKKMMLVK